MNNDIAIIGIAGRFPQAETLDEFWENLCSGRESIRPLPPGRLKELEKAVGNIGDNNFARIGYLDKISEFDPEYFEISSEEAKYIDPQQRLLLELVEEAIQEAGYSAKKLSERKVGVFTALSKNSYTLKGNITPMTLVNIPESVISGRIAYTYNFQGPALTIDTACSSSLVAIHYACQSIKMGECEYAITGGTRMYVIPGRSELINYLPITSKNQQVRAFDKDADGTIMGEGGAVLLLKRLDKALEDGDHVHAIIKGSAVNSDGRRSAGISAPNPDAQAEVILTALKQAQIDPETISYIETHGTGTKLGDPIEIQGINLAFTKHTEKKQFIAIGSLKSNIGHLDSCAGISGVIKTVLALKNKKIPPSINYLEPNPHIDFVNSPVYVNSSLKEWESYGPRRAGVTSLGLTGTNAHLILEEAPEIKRDENLEGLNIFTLSARNPYSLMMNVKRLRDHLFTHQGLSVKDIAYTLNTGRTHYPYRLALIEEKVEGLIQKLDQILIKEESEDIFYQKQINTSKVFSPIFIYTDFDSHDRISNEEIAQHEKIFKDNYFKCLKIKEDDLKLKYFAFQYALTKLLISYGIEPDAVLGVGFGKLNSDLIQEKFSFNEALNMAKIYQEEPLAIEEERLKAVVEGMIQDGHNLFIIIGQQRNLGERLKNILAGKSSVLSFQMNGSVKEFYRSICKLYTEGFNPYWEKMYEGQKRQKLSLPAYVFNRRSYFFELKLKRKGIQVLDLSEDEVEIKNVSKATFDDILNIFKDNLSEQIQLDMQGTFEEIGGDSISVMQIAGIIKAKYQVSIPLHFFFTASTFGELIHKIVETINQRLEQAKTQSPTQLPTERETRQEDFLKEDRIELPQFSLNKALPQNILLTGSTGFLGSHLLKELIKETDARIHCLVRGSDHPQAVDHFMERLNFYHGHTLDNLLNDRIIIVNGDVTRRHLGLGRWEYKKLIKLIDTVVHCAGDVRHHGKYAHFEKINVSGTKNILEFCLKGEKKILHHASTLAVAGRHAEINRFRECDLDIGQDLNNNVYGKSKFEAEKLIHKAKKQGLKASIYRIGNLIGRYSDGVFQVNIEDNNIYSSLKGIVVLGQIPEEVKRVQLELTPIDLCCQSMVKLMLLQDLIGNTYHIMNPIFAEISKIIDACKKIGCVIDEVDGQSFTNTIFEYVRNNKISREISHILTFIRGQNDPERSGGSRAFIPIDCQYTLAILKELGFEWPQLDEDYFVKMVEYCKKVKFF